MEMILAIALIVSLTICVGSLVTAVLLGVFQIDWEILETDVTDIAVASCISFGAIAFLIAIVGAFLYGDSSTSPQ